MGKDSDDGDLGSTSRVQVENKPNPILREIYLNFSQIRALVLKSIILQWRQYKTNICQIMLPFVLLTLTFLLQVLFNILIDNAFDNSKQPIRTLPLKFDKSMANRMIGGASNDYIAPEFFYAVNNGIDQTLLGEATPKGVRSGVLGDIYPFNISYQGRSVPYVSLMGDEKALNADIFEKLGKPGAQNVSAFGGFIFNKFDASSTFTSKFDYVVQYDNTTDEVTEYAKKFGSGRYSYNTWRGLIASSMINQANNAFFKRVTSTLTGSLEILTNVQRMPFTREKFRFAVADVLGTLIFPLVLSLLLPVFLYNIVLEKEGKLKEMMKLMGMRMTNYYLVTYVFMYMLYFITLLEFLILGSIFQFKVILSSNIFIVFLALFLWGFNLISFSFLLSSLINSTLVAVMIGYLLILFAPMIALIMITQIFKDKIYFRVSLVLFPFPLTEFFSINASRCVDGPCIIFEDLWKNDKLYLSIIFMAFNAIWMFVAAVYLDNVLPQKWGVRKPFYYPIRFLWSNRFYDIPQMIRKGKVHQYKEDKDSQLDSDVAEARRRVMEGKDTPETCAVLLDKLYKQYNADKVAVKGTYMGVGRSECFGMLGPNGAGKTTTISMLCGLFGPTDGTAYVNGYDIRSDMDEIHRNMGLCPQFDVLFEELTCQENLLFYSRVKGLPFSKEKSEVQRLLKAVGLTRKTLKGRSPLASSLSGGMKRRLSIAISLIGNPSVVMLDEPTTGLDPTTKRHLWDVILKEKNNRCVMLTTHSMEEADVLCDRIGIMMSGQFRCVGNSIHLKNKFGEGYRISVNYKEKDKDEAEKLVPRLIPESSLLVSFAGNTTYTAPRSAISIGSFFEAMEQNKSKFRVIDWSINQTSLEDVFLNIVKKDAEKESNEEYEKNKKLAEEEMNLEKDVLEIQHQVVDKEEFLKERDTIVEEMDDTMKEVELRDINNQVDF